MSGQAGIHDPRQVYLLEELFSLTLQGTVQRSRLYKSGLTEGERRPVRASLRQALNDAAEAYQAPVSDEQHCETLIGLSRGLSETHAAILRDGRFRIGHAQKALNLYLKYLWCTGRIPTPPHCPFDRIIIEKLPRDARLNWTTLDDIDKYGRLVEAARRVAGEQPLADWELALYSSIR